MAARARSLQDLLAVVGWTPQSPYAGHGIIDAYNHDLITPGEAQKLQSFGRLTPAAQKRELKRERDVSPEAIERTRAKLEDAKRRFEEIHGRRAEGD